MFFPVRASEDYGVLVIAEGPGPDCPGPNDEATYYHHNDNVHLDEAAVSRADAGDVSDVFHRLEYNEVVHYFSGIADGMGWGALPETGFDTLEEVWVWIRAQQKNSMIEHLRGRIAFHESLVDRLHGEGDGIGAQRKEEYLLKLYDELSEIEST